MPTYQLDLMLAESDAPEVGHLVTLDQGRVAVKLNTGGYAGITFYGTLDQLEAIGHGILEAIGRSPEQLRQLEADDDQVAYMLTEAGEYYLEAEGR